MHLFALLTLMHLPDRAFMRGELIFPPQSKHNHGSCIVECPNGDLLACWYNGSGERTADDVKIIGSRLRKGSDKWTEPFLMADTPGFPDCNACMVIDPRRRLWLFWPVILDNHWESALTLYKVSRDFQQAVGPPKWEQEKTLFLKPGPEFAAAVERDLDKQWDPAAQAAIAAGVEERLIAFLKRTHEDAKVTLKVRLGWMPRVHPFILDGKRLIVPLYSDRFDFSMMAITDDSGQTWTCSEPLVGPGNVQPSLALRKDGTLMAFFRDNGPPPHRVMVSESKDRGMKWSLARDIDLPNPGSGLEVLRLKSGRWLLIHNDPERGRHSLAVSLSEDEGRTWKIAQHLERDDREGGGAGSYSYPSIIQAKDGSIHATYSYTPNAANAIREGKGESIKHVRFTEEWVMAQ